MDAATVRTRVMPDATVVVEMFGVIEGDAVDDLRKTLVEILMRRRPARIVVDATAATVIDSVALGALTAAADTAEDLAVEFTVVRAGVDPLSSAESDESDESDEIALGHAA